MSDKQWVDAVCKGDLIKIPGLGFWSGHPYTLASVASERS
ncbi:hypothetical protein HMPREF9104_03349 [Lentilactobacillus kisonensis F0435]|uniref:Uncharacterized protein n=1 Tax=Lentilactobacillus kisonensis F0435 TaxID=797516 RepID=H1LL41_9LACO|nr:hypothetical protein HMPREF9104_03349 [Lentilactobacillus kisonensis F0435]